MYLIHFSSIFMTMIDKKKSMPKAQKYDILATPLALHLKKSVANT